MGLMPRASHRTACCFGRYLSALAAQLLHPGSDRWKIVGGPRSAALAAELFHARPDRWKIISSAG
jgi:hypothetical protein